MHEKVAKLVIERATVIFNLLARHLTRWSCRASERYNVLAWRSKKCAGPVLMLRAASPMLIVAAGFLCLTWSFVLSLAEHYDLKFRVVSFWCFVKLLLSWLPLMWAHALNVCWFCVAGLWLKVRRVWHKSCQCSIHHTWRIWCRAKVSKFFSILVWFHKFRIVTDDPPPRSSG